ncbi:epiplakin [Scomber japonicus]|uniref:epiplakin n=1 Tax=Scomber japonicus TaxID=13676 RepID=UPI0023052BEB|nr:epiplakin [Scomber japonicus]
MTSADVIKINSVRDYLQGKSCVAGVITQPSNQKLSISEAQRIGILTPGTALCLLEAQAATGYIVEPLKNKKLTVEQALREKVIGPQVYEKLLSAERAVTGYTDPYTDQKISLFQALKKDLIVKQHGIRLLEAQIATGGIIDPLKCLHLPLEVAYRKGYFDAELNQILSDPTDDTKGFFDPKTQDNLTYIEMLGRCVKDEETGLLLLPLNDIPKDVGTKANMYTDAEIKQEFEKTDVSISVGRYSGKSVSLWDLIHSGYLTEDQRLELIEKYRTRKINTQTIITLMISTIENLEMSETPKMIMGLRKPVSAQQLLDSDIVDAATFKLVKEGKLTFEEVTQRESVRGYLNGTGGIAGIKVHPSQKVMSIYEAKKKDLLTPGIALLLLEAQAATGWVIDPLKNKFYTVDEAAKEKVIGPDVLEQLLSAERAVTGYKDPYTDATVSLFEAMKEQLIQRSDGFRLLEAQIATGGIIDPNQSHRLPLHVAIKKGYLDEEISNILLNPTDDAKGFFDPNTKDNLSYLQLMKQCEKDLETGLLLLPLYEAKEKKFKGLRKQVSASELYESKIISKELFTQIIQGEITEENVDKMESIQKYLGATNCIAGVRVESTKRVMSIYEAKTKGLLTPGTSLVLLEAQAATGFVIDPVKNKKLSVEEAAAQGVVGSEWKKKLISAERAVTGYKDPYTGDTISLFQALKKELIVKDHGIRLLEAQIATGGIIDPVHSHRVPVQVAYQRGYFDEEMNQILSDPDDDTKGFFDPNTQENLTYLQLVDRCVTDPVTGLSLLVIVKKDEFYFFVDEATKLILKSTTTTKAGGRYQGISVSLWDLLYSKYITEEKRRELVQQYKSGGITIERFLEIILTIIQQQTTTSSSSSSSVIKCQLPEAKVDNSTTKSTITTTVTETSEVKKFHGIRKDVSATELLESKIINEDLYKDLRAGKVTVSEVSELVSVQKYLEGTNSIAGVYLQSTKETLSIHEAKCRRLLTPGTSLVLLEAQAATGFVIDPVKNKKLSVEEAAAQGVVGGDWKNKLLSAERAVTGYKDPYTGDTISLFQALKKDLIVKDHGIRLLEAQIATGGIIDPVHSHRVPVQVAYQRGYFDEEMNQILSDPDDDTKGFFDPNTQENLTYLQLIERCITDPVTGLSLLVIAKKGEFYFFVDEATKLILKSTTTTKAGGRYQGISVSLWDLLYSKYITEEKRRELVQQYKSGAITIERFLEIILTIIQQQTTTSSSSSSVIKCQLPETKVDSSTTKSTITTTVTETSEVKKFHGIRKDVSATELLESKIINEDLYKDLRAGKVTVSEVSELVSVQKYLEGTNSIAGVYLQSTKETLSIHEAKCRRLLTPGTSLVLLEAQAATGFVIDPVKNKKLSVEEAAAQGVVGGDWKNKLLSAERAVTGYKDPYTGDTISLFQALKKDLIVKDHGIRLLEAQIATGGIIDPVHSHRVPVQVAYQRGYFDEEMNQILSDPDDDTKGFFDPNTQENLTYLQLIERCITDPVTGLSLLVIAKKGEFYFFVDEATKLILKSTTTTKAGGRYQGISVSLWDLLYSKYITEEKRRELVQQYKSGAITIERFLEIILTIIQQQTTTSSSSSSVIKCQLPETKVDSSTTKSTITTTVTETSEVKKFHGIRKDVSATELLESKIINEDLYKDLRAGKVTVSEVSELVSVQKYLEGTNSIAGVYLQSTKETLSIHEAKCRRLLTPGTSLVLLEAQAATGFVIDPVKNKKLSVEEAAAQGVVGGDWKNKLLSAERAVTGYKDPYTGDTISLFQALKKDLIVKDHGIRLLEAQIATGGIIDPVHSHRVPVQVAYQRGYFDEEMNQILSDPDDDTKGFFDPNTQENLTYLQLIERCITDPVTGLSLLVIAKKGEFYFFVDEATKLILKSTTTTKAGGRYQGISVSLWDLLYSKYITEEKRRELVQQYKSGAITIERFMEIILTIIQQQTTTSSSSSSVIKCQLPETKVDSSTTKSTITTTVTETSEVKKFHGIRKDVSATELLESKIINEDLYKDLRAGKVTVSEVSELVSVQKYLEGTNSIAGVYLQSTKETLSIYEAKCRRLLTPGTSLVLLEAQAATGFVIDPVKNKKLSVEEAAAQGVVGGDWKNKLLSAERAVTGYKDPYTGDTISLFQALKKDLIVKDHGIRLLEAQIATGGIIDPVHSHRVPVQVAYQRGYFDEEMNQILSDPDDDTKGFFDPNTQENLTYLQLIERCITDPVTGLSLLVIAKKGEFYFFVDEATKLILKSTTTTKAGGRYQGISVSLWDLLYSKYITEEKRRELVQQYKSGAITIERFLEIILTIIQQQTTTSSSSSSVIKCQLPETKVDSSTTKSTITTTVTETSEVKKFHGIRKDVSATELLESKIINEDLYKDLRAGKVTVSEVSELVSVQKYLEGTNSIAGVYLQSTKETLSIHEAKCRRLLTPGTSLVLLEAQAATGFVIDPVKNKKLSVEEAAAQGVVGGDWKNKLLSAERAVTGYKDPYTGDTISLFQALKKDLIVKDHGIRLLEAQIATGGIIDPVHSHRVPVQVAYQRGYFDEEMNQILSDPDDDTKGFFDPNTQENLTYLQLIERCITDPVTGLSLLVIAKKGEFYFFVDEATKLILKSTTTTKAGGRYQGISVSLWDLLYSKYITEEKRRELVQQYKSGAITIERFMEIILTIIQQQTTTSSSSSSVIKCQLPETKVDSSTTKSTITTTVTETSEVKKFHGIRKDVSATELLESKIINEDLYKDLRAGKVTVSEVSELVSVQKYLEGTNSIAGVYLQSTKETLSIYEAKCRRLLTPGTSLVLLEAQAATGFVIDPVKNKKLSVEEAAAQGVVGGDWKNKLLSAERAVTGYKDPYTGDTISLFQALKKDLIVKDHGIRLLEAQIATGGIIDPVHSHRVPVQVAYQRGYFDEEMNQILSDPDDDTKGFFDPNTQENLTYLQLIERCITDPVTGLSLLVIAKKGEFYFFVDEATKLILKSTTTTKAGGRYQGISVSLWDLLYSKYITEEKRRELVQQYKSGAITIERFLEIILTIIQQQTTTSSSSSSVIKCQLPETKVDSSTTKSTITTTVTETSEVKKFHGIRKDVSATELLESKIINEDLYKDLRAGKVTVSEVSELVSVQKYLEGTNSIAGVYLQSTKETLSIHEAKCRRLLTPGTSLVLLEAQAATGFVIDPVKNKKLSVEEAAAQGVVGGDWKNKLLSAERAVTGYKDPYTGDTISLFQALKKDLIVKDHGIRLLEAQIATGGIIDPVHSHRVPVQVAYQRGYFDEEMNQILSDPDDDTKGFFDPNTQENLTYLQLIERCITDPVTGLSLLVIAKKGEFYFFVDEATKLILKSTTTTKAGGRYQGISVSLWDLLYSKYITEEKRRELVQQYKSGAITIERFMEIILTIIQQQTTTSSSSSSVIKCQLPETKVDSSTTKSTITTTVTETSEVKKFHGIRKDVSATELLESKIINEDLYKDLSAGKVTVSEVSELVSVQKYLEGTNSIAGVYLQSTKETLSIYEAKCRRLLTPGTSLVLLEAQAATGFVIDPVKNKKLSVEEAAAQGVVGGDWKNKLLSAERAVTGYKDPYTGDTISLFQALKKDLIVKDHGIRLLEAQIATGGIIDPVHSHRVPVQVAYQRGYFDEEMNQILSDPDDDTKGFFDPNTQENLTYLQLIERCITDPVTGLSLLVIAKKGEFYFFVDEATKLILKSTTTTKAGGRYQGISVSLWDLLYSKYITEEKRRELVQQYKSGAITIERFLEIILTIIQQQTTTSSSSSSVIKCQLPETKVDSSTTKSTITTTVTETSEVKKFHGIRKDVSATELLESKIINEDLYKDLRAGKVTVSEVSELVSVQKYLEGTNSIAGVYLQSTKETLSIHEAKCRRLLTPGTSLVLLEAQAATGFVIDPVKNKKLSVEEAAAQGVVGGDWKNKLLSAERAVTGYKDPYTGDTISLFQALKKDLIVKDHGIRLLEAQIATGGIIDPVHSHRVPVQVAYQRGYFDEEMNQILSDPDDDTKGFFDPNTQENLTYLQLIERCITDPVTGLSLLVIAKKGEFYFFVDEATKLILKSTTTTKAGGRYQGISVSLWDLLYSKYITEEKRRELVQQYKSGAITIERFMEIILTIIQQQTTTSSSSSSVIKCQLPETKVDSSTTKSTITTTVTETSEVKKFHGIRKDVSATELLESKIINEDLYKDLSAGKVTVSEVSELVSVQKYLEGTNSIAGVYLQSTKETLSIYEAKCRRLLTPGTSLVLLEAQAATGFVIDPVKNKKLSVEEAAAQGVVGGDWKNKLLSAERAVTGYKDPYTGDTISLFQALKKDLIVKDHGIRLLEAQIATGGIIDPVHSHRVPVQVAYQRGYFDEEMNQILSDPDDDTKGFFDPNTQENLTYLQLIERCITDPVTGLSLLVIAKKGEFYFFVDEATKLILKSTTTTKAGGRYQGISVSLWDLLYSKYITEEKRRELVQQYKSGAITIERFLEIILTIIQQQTTTSSSSSSVIKRQLPETKVDSSTTKTTITTTVTETSEVKKFHGIRKDVSATELLESKIINEALYKDLSAGKVTVSEVSVLDSVRKYLEGTNSIAGVYLQSTKETLSIYNAKSKGLLTPGTSLVLLEAQAATGFVIDPVKNKKLSVEEAAAQGVVGSDWKKKLLSAERAVTGYKDPYTGDTISLFQALKKDLIVKDHGIRLLEAQIATGGIIDPVHSHRVPVEVAYQRGYFDEEMNQILSDPDDDTKGFFDPNTKENLTYLQLLERCITDPHTGLCLLPLHK